MSLDYLHGPNISISVPTTARQESQRHKRRVGGRGDDGSRSQREELEDAVLLALKMEEGAVSQGVQVPLEAGHVGKQTSPWSPRRGPSSSTTIGSDHRYSKIISMCCFKTLGSW